MWEFLDLFLKAASLIGRLVFAVMGLLEWHYNDISLATLYFVLAIWMKS